MFFAGLDRWKIDPRKSSRRIMHIRSRRVLARGRVCSWQRRCSGFRVLYIIYCAFAEVCTPTLHALVPYLDIKGKVFGSERD